MALMPGASHRLISRHNGGARMAVYNRVNLHVAVSEAKSLYGYFSGVADCSHFYVAKDGTIEQYIDTAYRSKADYNGNDATISIETQGGVTSAQGEPWTEAQLASLARIWAWARDTHGIPNVIATSSRAGSNRGLSWHRLGVPGQPTATGGVLYSKSRGKICPGDAKIAQVPNIFARANGQVPVDNPVTSTPSTPAVDARPRNADGSLRIAVDGSRGPATIARWQEVMGTPIDGKISKPSALIKADQGYLNREVASHLKNLVGGPLTVDGYEGAKTIKVRQFLLFNRFAPAVLGRVINLGKDVDGIAGAETIKLHQHALNQARARSGKY